MEHLTSHFPGLTDALAGLLAGIAAVQTWFRDQSTYVKIAVVASSFLIVVGLLSLIA
jgi:hypothetical protein